MASEPILGADELDVYRARSGPNGGAPQVAIFSRPVLDSLLTELGKREEFYARLLSCPVCRQAVGWTNLRVIVPRDHTADFICDGPLCYHQYLGGVSTGV